jgi:hypothetical protein
LAERGFHLKLDLVVRLQFLPAKYLQVVSRPHYCYEGACLLQGVQKFVKDLNVAINNLVSELFHVEYEEAVV